MNINLQWVTLAFKLAPLIVGAVHAVEKVVRGAKGKDKQDAAVDFLRLALMGTELGTGKDLLNDAAFEEAVRKAIDAIVAVENLLAAKQAALAPAV